MDKCTRNGHADPIHGNKTTGGHKLNMRIIRRLQHGQIRLQG